MTFRIPSSMVEQNLSVDSVTADSVNGVGDLELFLQQQKASNGYQILPGGVIIQWGTTASLAAGSTTPITFPFTFPGQCTGLGYMPSFGAGTYVFGYNSLTNSSVNFVASSGNNAAAVVKWIAVGY